MRFGREVTLAVLAGGDGARLGGVAKPLLLLDGRPLVAQILERVPAADALIVTRTPARYAGFAARVVTDRVDGGGPLAGLQAALEEARTGWIALVAGDMPWVHAAALQRLADRVQPGDGWAAFTRDGRTEPLPALYARSLLPRFAALLAQGAGLQALLAEAPGRLVGLDVLEEVDPALESLRGVNTPEDAARWEVTAPRGEP